MSRYVTVGSGSKRGSAFSPWHPAVRGEDGRRELVPHPGIGISMDGHGMKGSSFLSLIREAERKVDPSVTAEKGKKGEEDVERLEAQAKEIIRNRRSMSGFMPLDSVYPFDHSLDWQQATSVDRGSRQDHAVPLKKREFSPHQHEEGEQGKGSPLIPMKKRRDSAYQYEEKEKENNAYPLKKRKGVFTQPREEAEAEATAAAAAEEEEQGEGEETEEVEEEEVEEEEEEEEDEEEEVQEEEGEEEEEEEEEEEQEEEEDEDEEEEEEEEEQEEEEDEDEEEEEEEEEEEDSCTESQMKSEHVEMSASDFRKLFLIMEARNNKLDSIMKLQAISIENALTNGTITAKTKEELLANLNDQELIGGKPSSPKELVSSAMSEELERQMVANTYDQVPIEGMASSPDQELVPMVVFEELEENVTAKPYVEDPTTDKATDITEVLVRKGASEHEHRFVFDVKPSRKPRTKYLTCITEELVRKEVHEHKHRIISDAEPTRKASTKDRRKMRTIFSLLSVPCRDRKCDDAVDSDDEEGENSNDDLYSNIKKRHGTIAPVAKTQCTRINGKGWRCARPALAGYNLCEHHSARKGKVATMSHHHKPLLHRPKNEKVAGRVRPKNRAVKNKRMVLPTFRSIRELMETTERIEVPH